MRLAAAQTCSVPGDVAANAAGHLEACRVAAEHGAALVLFPELSLSGYEPGLVRQCVLDPDSPVLAPMRRLARERGLAIVAGAPVPAEDGHGVAIGAIVLQPDGGTSLYRKHFLHPGEEAFAAAGSRLAHVQPLAGFQAGLAICADTTHEAHPAAARAQGADLYLAGVFWTPGGYDVDAAMIESYARTHRMGCLVANHGGPSGGFPAGGRSAFWAPGGALVGTAPDQGSALLLAEERDGAWTCRTVGL